MANFKGFFSVNFHESFLLLFLGVFKNESNFDC